MKLLPSRCTFCVHATMHHFTYSVTSFEATYSVLVCLLVTCHLRFLGKDRCLLRAIAVTRGGTDTEIRVSTQKLTLENKILPPLIPTLEPATFRSRARHSVLLSYPFPPPPPPPPPHPPPFHRPAIEMQLDYPC